MKSKIIYSLMLVQGEYLGVEVRVVNTGKIIKIDPREIWKYEARHFTPWLAKNIDYLSDVLNMDIAVQTVEGNVGPYFVDIYGEDSSGNKIIIENPSVVKIKIQGHESFQISGDVKEEQAGISESDIKTVSEKTGKSLKEAKKALEESSGDLAEAIMNLS